MVGFYCPCTGNSFFDGLFCIIAFERIAENGEKIQIWVNMSDETQQADIAEGAILCNNYSETSQKALNPYQAVMVRCR